jgi:hypothetical protein
LKTKQAGFGTPGGWSGSLPSKAHSAVYGKGTGQVGNLPPIVNRRVNFGCISLRADCQSAAGYQPAKPGCDRLNKIVAARKETQIL